MPCHAMPCHAMPSNMLLLDMLHFMRAMPAGHELLRSMACHDMPFMPYVACAASRALMCNAMLHGALPRHGLQLMACHVAMLHTSHPPEQCRACICRATLHAVPTRVLTEYWQASHHASCHTADAGTYRDKAHATGLAADANTGYSSGLGNVGAQGAGAG